MAEKSHGAYILCLTHKVDCRLFRLRQDNNVAQERDGLTHDERRSHDGGHREPDTDPARQPNVEVRSESCRDGEDALDEQVYEENRPPPHTIKS